MSLKDGGTLSICRDRGVGDVAYLVITPTLGSDWRDRPRGQQEAG